MKKLFYMTLTLVCTFSFMGMAKAEQLRIATDLENGAYATTVGDLILGKDLSSDTTATQLFNKYTVYYAKVDISKDLYEKYKAERSSNSTDKTNQNQVVGLIRSVDSGQNLSDPWIALTNSKKIDYSALTKGSGYLIGVAVVDKTDNSKVYVSKAVVEATSETTVNDFDSLYGSSTNTDEVSTTTETESTEEVPKEDESEVTKEQTTSNPNTGLNDYVMYMIPFALIGGSTLIFKRREA